MANQARGKRATRKGKVEMRPQPSAHSALDERAGAPGLMTPQMLSERDERVSKVRKKGGPDLEEDNSDRSGSDAGSTELDY
ncbi:hypothetical protein SAMN05444358_10226 [Ruegeria halocynthiae]|uniref:Uncharacterized protein n=1 Tax=Ruegeria halocynthiae TaxID=985054 RepID=A0A1H2XRP1_9RHOB|nr:hypothetical protein [Ruegeria halocynthiae]SDW95144.1 hypothetical protein SAMN05444358_10226 [Ruegeria halocynthiae]